jgi:hypothetical protein
MRGEVRTGLLGWCSFLVRETGEVPDHGSASQHSSNLNQSISFLAGWFFFWLLLFLSRTSVGDLFSLSLSR